MLICRHIHDSGHTCGCPALRGEQFCYHHLRIHKSTPDPRRNPEAFIPPLESPEAVEITVTNIMRAVCEDKLDVKKASCLFRGLAVLERLWKRKDFATRQPLAEYLHEPMAEALNTAEGTTIFSSPDPAEAVGSVEDADPSADYVGADALVCPPERSSGPSGTLLPFSKLPFEIPDYPQDENESTSNYVARISRIAASDPQAMQKLIDAAVAAE